MAKKPPQQEVFLQVIDDDHLYILNQDNQKGNAAHIKTELVQQGETPTIHVEEVTTDQVLDMVCETHVNSNFGVGSTYESHAEFEEALNEYMDVSHTVYTKYDSKTVDRVNRDRKVKALLDETRFKYRSVSCLVPYIWVTLVWPACLFTFIPKIL